MLSVKYIPVDAASETGTDSPLSNTKISYFLVLSFERARAVDKPKQPAPTMMILELGSGAVYMLFDAET